VRIIIKKYIKKIIPYQLFILSRNIQSYMKSWISKWQIWRLVSKHSGTIKLEIGSGSKKGDNGWVTLDMISGCDIYWNLEKGLPFPSNSIAKIYSSHVFEHFNFKVGQTLLAECHRVLISGGVFSICVPNANIFIRAYIEGVSLDKNKYFGHRPAFNNTSSIDYVNYIAYMDGHHKYMFDENNLISYLKLGKFEDISLRSFDQNCDLLSRDFESIYACAIKQ